MNIVCLSFVTSLTVFLMCSLTPSSGASGLVVNLREHSSVRSPLVVFSHRVPVIIEFGKSLSSRKAKSGDSFTYTVVEDVVCHGVVVLVKGLRGTGIIESTRRAGTFGRDGRMSLHLGPVQAVDGTSVELGLPTEDSRPGESEGLAAGASLVGLAALGPLGLAGGALVKGDDVLFDPDTRVTVYPLRPALVRGLLQ